jgi:hypothetical protein
MERCWLEKCLKAVSTSELQGERERRISPLLTLPSSSPCWSLLLCIARKVGFPKKRFRISRLVELGPTPMNPYNLLQSPPFVRLFFSSSLAIRNSRTSDLEVLLVLVFFASWNPKAAPFLRGFFEQICVNGILVVCCDSNTEGKDSHSVARNLSLSSDRCPVACKV